ncbi:MAG: DUF3791 domain-containing protein [Ruminococcus callidus]|nr:DUF3791 domain-containing protein [Ruminococcus callidus]
MSKEMEFFIFLIEQYAKSRKTTANKVLELWDTLGLSDLIYNMYERYHCEALDNAFEDIDSLVKEKQSEVCVSEE